MTHCLSLLKSGGLALITLAGLSATQQALAQQAPGSAVPTIAAAAFYEACSGHWAGVLEYRDYQSDQRVSLPTNLDNQFSGDGKSLTLAYTYDDGPGKILREKASFGIDSERRQVSIISDDKSVEQFSIAEYAPGQGRIRVVLTGVGEDNGKKVEVRATITCTSNRFNWLRETRLPGQDFAFRHQYSLTRYPIQAH